MDGFFQSIELNLMTLVAAWLFLGVVGAMGSVCLQVISGERFRYREMLFGPYLMLKVIRSNSVVVNDIRDEKLMPLAVVCEYDLPGGLKLTIDKSSLGLNKWVVLNPFGQLLSRDLQWMTAEEASRMTMSGCKHETPYDAYTLADMYMKKESAAE